MAIKSFKVSEDLVDGDRVIPGLVLIHQLREGIWY